MRDEKDEEEVGGEKTKLTKNKTNKQNPNQRNSVVAF
jgi:hypothetical protein